MKNDTQERSDPFSRRLDVLIALTLQSIRQGKTSTKADAVFLASFGLTQPEIANILGVSVSGISKALGRTKKS